MKISKRQLKRIIREEKRKIMQENIGTGLNGSVALDHLINCYVDGLSDEECADSMPNEADNDGLQDFANFVMRVVNTYNQQGNF